MTTPLAGSESLMRRIAILITTLALTMSGLAIVPAQAKSKATKPSAPTVSALSSSTPKKGKVNVTITITLPASDGGSKITGSKVTAGGKSCTIAKTKTSCTIKSIKNGKSLNVTAKSKNKKGFGPASTSVTYTAGAIAWPTTPVATVVADTSVSAGPAPVAAPAPLTCATGGTCALGDTGPGGGNIFYVATGTFSCGLNLASTCRYLEAAPSGWNNNGVAADDPFNAWATGSINIVTTVSGSDGIAIGTGYQNSVDIANQANNVAASSAAVAARAYTGGSKSDWFLPSKDELNQMCKWANAVAWTSDATACTEGTLNLGTGSGLGAAGFVAQWYWSSSEVSNEIARMQYFPNGNNNNELKSLLGHVRPVRAF